MIDHIGITVSNLAVSKTFYTIALSPINYQLLLELPAAVTGTTDVACFGEQSKPDFCISLATPDNPVRRPSTHLAFRVPSRALVDAFYRAAIGAGGTDNGGPGLRPHYHPNYYGAFVLDPDGYNIEAVCHEPQ